MAFQALARYRARQAVRVRYAPNERIFTRFEKMTKLEKTALASATIGAAFNIFLYSIGYTLDQAGSTAAVLFAARMAVGLLTAAAFDLISIVTVLGQRAGRRSSWSTRTAWASAIVSALIALDVSGVWKQPWLHAANSLIVLSFMLHLAAPRRTPRMLQIRQLAHRLAAALRQARHDLAGARQAVTAADSLVIERDSLLAALRRELAEARQDLVTADRQLTSAQRELADRDSALAGVRREMMAARPPARQEEVIRVVAYEFSWPDFERFVAALAKEMTERPLSNSTIRRRVAALAAPVTGSEV